MKSIFTFIIICLSSLLSLGQDTLHTLDFNNVNATISNSGSFFFNPDAWSNPNVINEGYIVPKGSGINAIHFVSSCFAAEDASGNNFTSVGGNGLDTDIDRGPYSTLNAYSDPSYDRSYMITICQDEIDQFKLWWECANGTATVGCENVQQPSYSTLSSIYDWPAHGDQTLGQSYYLAPFYDRDGDGTYDPVGQGDYPIIKGCCATYLIQNDAGVIHTLSGTDPIGIEMHYMLYHFGANDFLYNTTFVDVMAINRSQTDYVDFKHSIYFDATVGVPYDDFIGSDSLNNMLYLYNSDNNDEGIGSFPGYGENPPAIGIVGLDSPISSAVPYDNMGTPSYVNYMNGLRNDGTPWTDANGLATKFMYSGNPNNSAQWSEVSENNQPDNRRGFITTSYGAFNSGDTAVQSYAIIYSRIGNNLENAEHLSTLAAEAKAFYDSDDDGCDAGGFASLEEVEDEQLLIYPNPSLGEFFIETPEAQLKSVQIVDVTGKSIDFTKQVLGSSLKINVTEKSPGIYLVYIETERGFFTERIIIE